MSKDLKKQIEQLREQIREATIRRNIGYKTKFQVVANLFYLTLAFIF